MVATDDERIAAVVRGFGGEVVHDLARATRPAPTGWPRRCRAIEAEIVVNVQGDEPMLDPAGIDAAAGALLERPGAARWRRSRCPSPTSRRCSRPRW